MKKVELMWSQFKCLFVRHLLVTAVLLAIAVILAVSSNYFFSFPSVRSTDQAVWGQFGDYFGGVLNPLLSFFALVGLMITLRSQQSESKKSEERHNEALFDSRLFQLLTLSHSAVSSVRFVRSSPSQSTATYEGHRAVAFALNRLQEDYFYKAERGGGSEMYGRLLPEFAKWKVRYWSAIASYIESMLFLVEYVVESAKGKDNIEFAMRAVFAQMSAAEKLLLFYVMIFSENSKIMLSGLLNTQYLASAADDDLKPYRRDLLHSAVLARLTASAVK